MKAILVADREPYLHYRTKAADAPDKGHMQGGTGNGKTGHTTQIRPELMCIATSGDAGSIVLPEPIITIEVRPRPVFEEGADLYVIPADMFTSLTSRERPHPSFAYGPVSMMEAAFDAGCMDYLRDPWIIPELEARSVRYETLRFSIGGHIITVNSRRMSTESGEPVSLRHAEYVALRLLVMAHCSCLSRESLEYAIWGVTRPKSRSLDVLMSSLRSCLDKVLQGAGDSLNSARGFGYRLETGDCS